MPFYEDSKKKKAEESIHDEKPPAKRYKKNGNEILHSIPWSGVFQFLGGEDVAKALMASKHQNPWKLLDVSALKDRLEATDYGKELLEKYYDNASPQFLPKLLYCMDRGCGIRYDGLYQFSQEPLLDVFIRFYPTGEVLGTFDEVGLDSMWCRLDKEKEENNNNVAIGKGTYQCDFLPTGQNLFLVKPAENPVLALLPGPIGPNGELTLFTQSTPRKFQFVKP